MTTIAYMDTEEDRDTGSWITGVYCPTCAEIVAGEQTRHSATAAEMLGALTADELAEEFEDADLCYCDRCKRLLTGED